MLSKKPLLQIAVPGIAALLALTVAMRSHEGMTMASSDGATPYSADHARVQATAPDEEQPPTF